MTYKNYMLVLLLLLLAFNYVDRLVLALTLQDIKIDLDLSDTELGVLSGIAFALFYAIMGIPIARWADRGNRVTVISATTALWSTMVVLCGTAGSFMQLILIRVGVAVGEAGCIPVSHSLVADYFSRAERPRAVGIFLLGSPLSLVFGYLVAGWLNELYGWRATFMLLGIPGVILAVLARFTLREPRVMRGDTASSLNTTEHAESGVGASLKEVLTRLWNIPTFRNILLAMAVVHFFGAGISKWQPTFFIRTHGMTTGELGTWLATVAGLGGFLGTYLGGALATRYAGGNEQLQLRATAIACAIFVLIEISIYLSPNKYVALCMSGLATATLLAINGPIWGTIQTLVPERMRAMAFALIYLFANLVGYGLGPLAAGALSDALAAKFAQDSLRYSLLAFSPGYFWVAAHLWMASRTVGADMTEATSKFDDSAIVERQLSASGQAVG